MKLGKYFNLDELLVSHAGARYGLKNTPTPEVVEQLRRLVAHVLDPLRQAAGAPVHIYSGYRSPEVNRVVGGSKTSQHLMGQAADLIVTGMTVRQVCDLIRKLNLPYDQLIDEFGQWVHVSFGPRNRRQFLTARKVNGKTIYAPAK